MTKFKAYRLREVDRKVGAAFEEMTIDELDKGDVVIRVAYSSVNYKDALAATGAGRIIRRFPCVGGVDLAGTVVESADTRFAKGDAVIATSYDIGVAHDGGYAEYARIPADWIVPMPRGLTLHDAMALGTAGFTAGLAVERMEHDGLAPANGPVVVSGATGGVGSIAVDILSRRGYHVVALTGKEAESDYLRHLGAKEVMLRSSLDLAKIKPLDKATWAGAVDNLGGEVLAWIASTMQVGGTIASVGLAASMNLNTTVAPFILRGASLLGVDSVNCPMPQRRRVWERLATDLRPAHLAAFTRTIPFAELPTVFDAFVQAKIKGRVVVDLAP
jgi:putative YhdH/YhfP family quinone oxidoreductase